MFNSHLEQFQIMDYSITFQLKKKKKDIRALKVYPVKDTLLLQSGINQW